MSIMKRLEHLQTKEDIRQLMIDALHYAMPEINSYNNYPIIVSDDDNDSKINIEKNIYWLWILPDGKGIRYGYKGRNRVTFIPRITENISTANVGACATFDAFGAYTSEELNSKITVQKAIYKEKDTSPNLVIHIIPPKEEVAEISRLYHKIYETEFL